MKALPEPLAGYVAVCPPVVGSRTVYPSIHDPARKSFDAERETALDAHGWPATLAGVRARHRAVDRALTDGTGEGPAVNVALIGIEIAYKERIPELSIESGADCTAKLDWLRLDLLGAAGDGHWVTVLDDALDRLSDQTRS